MAVSAPFHVYAGGVYALASKLDNLGSDVLKCALLSSYTLGTTLVDGEFQGDIIKSGVGVEVANGSGYTTGGVALSGVSLTRYYGTSGATASEWATTWAATTAYTVGAIVRPATANNYLYSCVVAGTSGASAPSFPTVVGTTVVDSGATWLCVGGSVTVLGASNISWTSSGGSFTASYGLLYDSTPGTAASNPIVGYWDFSGSPQTASGGGTLTITVPSSGILAIPTS